MPAVPIEDLTRPVEHLHGCRAKWREAVPVREEFQGKVVWDGTVQAFDLAGHPSATRCYAWSHYVGLTERRWFVAVLEQSVVDSPRAAVRVAIAAERRRHAT